MRVDGGGDGDDDGSSVDGACCEDEVNARRPRCVCASGVRARRPWKPAKKNPRPRTTTTVTVSPSTSNSSSINKSNVGGRSVFGGYKKIPYHRITPPPVCSMKADSDAK